MSRIVRVSGSMTFILLGTKFRSAKRPAPNDTTSARLYWENNLAFFEPKHLTIPVAVSVFPDEIYAAPQTWTERAYPQLIYFNKLDKGGHFAAWEQPQVFSEELRKAFRSLREKLPASSETTNH